MRRQRARLTIVAALLLGLAATLTALAAYQGSLKDGEALEGYTRSTTALSDANYFFSQGNQVFAGDQQLFVQYATAAQEGQDDLTAYLTTLMRPAMADAVEWWQDDPDALTPFDEADGNPYEIVEFAQGEEEAAASGAAFKAAGAADKQGDEFGLATVLLALTLFFAGVATLFRRRAVTVALLGIGAVALAAGSWQLVAALA